MSYSAISDQAKAAAIAAALDSRARRASGDASVTEGETTAVAALYVALKGAGWNAIDLWLAAAVERGAVYERFRVS